MLLNTGIATDLTTRCARPPFEEVRSLLILLQGLDILLDWCYGKCNKYNCGSNESDMNGNDVHLSHLLSVAEASELLRVSRVTVHRWIEKGRLTAIRLGNSRFVLKNEVEAICTARDGADLEARFKNILARRTPGWAISFVGEPTEHGPNIMVAIGPDGERITFRFEILEESKSTKQEQPA